MTRMLVVVSLLLACVVASPSLEAQFIDGEFEEENKDTYPSDCLAEWDPFCPQRPPGSGEAYNNGCFECFYIPEGPNGEPSYYICDNTGGAGKPSRCTNYSWGCTMSGVCQLA